MYILKHMAHRYFNVYPNTGMCQVPDNSRFSLNSSI